MARVHSVKTAIFQNQTTPTMRAATQCDVSRVVCVSALHADWTLASEAEAP
jgi:hypothetical protein